MSQPEPIKVTLVGDRAKPGDWRISVNKEVQKIEELNDKDNMKNVTEDEVFRDAVETNDKPSNKDNKSDNSIESIVAMAAQSFIQNMNVQIKDITSKHDEKVEQIIEAANTPIPMKTTKKK